jgi:hypothetical protein
MPTIAKTSVLHQANEPDDPDVATTAPDLGG